MSSKYITYFVSKKILETQIRIRYLIVHVFDQFCFLSMIMATFPKHNTQFSDSLTSPEMDSKANFKYYEDKDTKRGKPRKRSRIVDVGAPPV